MSETPLYALHKIGKIAKPRDIFIPKTPELRAKLIGVNAARELNDAELALHEKLTGKPTDPVSAAQQTQQDDPPANDAPDLG